MSDGFDPSVPSGDYCPGISGKDAGYHFSHSSTRPVYTLATNSIAGAKFVAGAANIPHASTPISSEPPSS
ncbi:hypothetical protein BHM03_00028531 [Ensete ventricosum]|nr:hypothetical protein BHM03_00028531 [Ensete ventricosum]